MGFCLLPFKDSEKDSFFSLSIAWLLLAFAAIQVGNYLINNGLNHLISWKKTPLTRLAIQLIVATVFSLFVFNLFYYFAKIQYTGTVPDINQYILLNVLGVTLIIPTISIFFGVRFLKALKESELEIEKIQKENTRSQMLSLRNHLDPHFLFNNLNILSSLIDQDVETSKTYLDKFAEVYRVILKSEMSDLTMISAELEMLESYIYLLQIRFDNSIQVTIDVQNREFALPPLSLQMLIENAIKHNITSKEKPLIISIISDNDYLKVCNNYQPKPYAPMRTEGTGLENIITRYSFFTESKVEVVKTEDKFCVNLPILEIEED